MSKLASKREIEAQKRSLESVHSDIDECCEAVAKVLHEHAAGHQYQVSFALNAVAIYVGHVISAVADTGKARKAMLDAFTRNVILNYQNS